MTDVDANGSPDFFWRHASTGQIVLWYMRDRSILGGGVAFGTVSDLNWQIVR